MLELDGSLWLRSGTQTWGGKNRIDLLAEIATTGSITAAARAVGMSYKGAWDAIDAMNNLAGEPLVVRTTGGKGGGGTQLTARARSLIATFRIWETEHRKFIDQLTRAGLDANGDINFMRHLMLKTSARNKLVGTITDIKTGAVNDEIQLRIAGGQTLTANITRHSTEELGLCLGKEAIALIKASSVLIGVPDEKLRLSARNQLSGNVSAVSTGAVNSEVHIRLAGDTTLVAIISNESVQTLGLKNGAPATAIFKASSVILGVQD